MAAEAGRRAPAASRWSFGQDRLEGVGDEVDRDDRLAMASAGKSVGHQMPAMMLLKSSLTVRPQSGDGGCRPTPRNDSVATVKMA